MAFPQFWLKRIRPYGCMKCCHKGFPTFVPSPLAPPSRSPPPFQTRPESRRFGRFRPSDGAAWPPNHRGPVQSPAVQTAERRRVKRVASRWEKKNSQIEKGRCRMANESLVDPRCVLFGMCWCGLGWSGAGTMRSLWSDCFTPKTCAPNPDRSQHARLFLGL